MTFEQDDEPGRFQGSFEPLPLPCDIGTGWQVLPEQYIWLDPLDSFSHESVKLYPGEIVLVCGAEGNRSWTTNVWCHVLCQGKMWTCHWDTLYYTCKRLP